MGCAIEKQKKQLNIKEFETCSKKNSMKNLNQDLSAKKNKQINEKKTQTDTLVISANSLCYQIINSNEKVKLRIINYYIDVDGRILSKQKEIKDEKLTFQFSLDDNNIILRRKELSKQKIQSM